MAGQPTNRGSIPGRGKRFVSSPKRPWWLSGSPSLLFNANRGAFRRGKEVEEWSHFNLATQLRMTTAVPPRHHTTSWRAKGQFYLTLNFPCGASTRFRVKASPYGASQSHSIGTPHPARLLWTSDQPDAENSTWQHTTPTKDKHTCLRRDSNSQSQQASGRRITP